MAQSERQPRVLVSIFHRPGAHDNNFENLKAVFGRFDIYIPRVEYYGRKWTDTKAYFLDHDYDCLFVICSDVSVTAGDICSQILRYATNISIGCYGFGTLKNCTFPWLRYDNISLEKDVPFIEGYCIGINRLLFNNLDVDNTYGYGIDVQIGYQCYTQNLRCIVNNEACISHAHGKSYSDQNATDEYKAFLLANPSIHNYLKNLQIFTPI